MDTSCKKRDSEGVRRKQNYIFSPTDSTDFHGENDTTTKGNSVISTDK